MRAKGEYKGNLQEVQRYEIERDIGHGYGKLEQVAFTEIFDILCKKG